MHLKTRTYPEQPCPGSLRLCAKVPWSHQRLQQWPVAMSVLYWVKTAPKLAGGSSGHERNVRKKRNTNLQLTEKAYS